MTHRFASLLCLVLAGAIALAAADTSVNLVWNTNPECLGPASGSASWNNLDLGTCESYNSTYNDMLYSYISSANGGICNMSGDSTYYLFTGSQCDGTGLATTFNTACTPWSATGAPGSIEQPLGTQPNPIPTSAEPLPQGIPIEGAPLLGEPAGTIIPIGGQPTDAQPTATPLSSGVQNTGSQQFSCNDSFERKPYVQLIGPGCSENASPSLNAWTVTWSNAVGCVAVYNVSTISLGFGNMIVTYAQVQDVCQPGSSNYSVNLYSDASCANQIDTWTFDDGCSSQFNATCYAASATTPAPETGAPLTPSGTIPSTVPDVILTPETTTPDLATPLANVPQFAPFFEPPTGAASTASASAFLLVAVAVLAYLL